MKTERNHIKAKIKGEHFRALIMLVAEFASDSEKLDWQQEKSDLANIMFKMWGLNFNQVNKINDEIILTIKRKEANLLFKPLLQYVNNKTKK